jgi:hypothetical protein
MKRIIATVVFLFMPVQAFAKDQLRKFRWSADESSMPLLLPKSIVGGLKAPSILPGVGELVLSEAQSIGPAKVQGTWRQAVYQPDGRLSYASGALVEGLPSPESLQLLEAELGAGLKSGLAASVQLATASQIFTPVLEVRKNEKGEWQPCWRVEYLTQAGDRLRFLVLSREGKQISEGEMDWDGVDGRAMVFPKGPKLSSAEERPLFDLNGDGTISGRLLKVFSALDLKVWSPEFKFFFAQDDRRFDLGQAYYTIAEGYRWLKEHLGVEIKHPIDVKLHVGEGGVSNAAFYHRNTIYLGTGDGNVYKDLIRDPSVLIHEGIHAVIDSYAGLPSEGEGGGFNEGFADLFTALILDNPRMGEASYLQGPYRRTLEHNLRAYKDFKPGVYQNGSIVAATFWDMKPVLGNELTAKLAFRTLVRLGRGAKFDDLPSALSSAAEGLLSADQKEMALQAARSRGWRIP